MAINVVIPLLIPLEENLHNATRLLSGAGAGPLDFLEPRYCAVLSEDAPQGATVVSVAARHTRGDVVRYSITGGNRDGLFTIDQHTGAITLAAPLDYELHDKHELVVAGEAGGQVVHTIVQVRVADVNDNAPSFVTPDPQVTLIEEDDRDLPQNLIRVEARDRDRVDSGRLVYSISGDGVDGLSPRDAYFAIDARTGQISQLRALDRDPPRGKDVWKVRVEVRDGQAPARGRKERFSGPSSPSAVQPPPSSPVHPPTSPRLVHPPSHSGFGHPPSPPGLLHAPSLSRIVHPPSPYGSVHPPSPFTSDEEQLSSHSRVVEVRPPFPSHPGRSPPLPWLQVALPDEEGVRAEEGGKDPTSSAAKGRAPLPPRSDGEGDAKRLPEETGDVVRRIRSASGDTPSGTRGKKLEESGTRTAANGGEVKGKGEASNRSYPPPPLQHPRRSGKFKLAAAAHKRKGMALQSPEHVPEGAPCPLYLKQVRSGQGTPDQVTQHYCICNDVTEKEVQGSEVQIREFPRKRKCLFMAHIPEPPAKPAGQLKKTFLPRRITCKAGEVADQSGPGKICTILVPKMPVDAESASKLKREKVRAETSKSKHLRPSEIRNKSGLTARPDGDENEDESDGHILQDDGDPRVQMQGEETEGKKLGGGNGMYDKLRESDPKESSSPGYNLDRKQTQNRKKNTHAAPPAQEPNAGNDIADPIAPNRRRERSVSERSVSEGSVSERSVSERSVSERSVSEGSVSERSVSEGSVSERSVRRPANPSKRFANVFEEASSAESGGCADVSAFGGDLQSFNRTDKAFRSGGEAGEEDRGQGGRVHLVETVLTVLVKDINDNPPVFPNATMFGEVQENGPIDLSVAVISAWDADDHAEGTNARLTYSIEKNVIHERSGEAIFLVHPHTGLIRTALCCLDRETTPEYTIQVVATDGGGLKGTGTVVVRLADVNDNSPRLTRQLWELEVEETWGDEAPANTTLLEITAADRDTANYFFYRVVERSGWGWEHFGVRAEGAVGHLYARQTLDYEDDAHRRGFKFMVQVTDRGPGGWVDTRHTDTAWVSVTLRDLNDNPPVFPRVHSHITVQEDVAPGSLLITLPAQDPDMDGRERVDYRVEGGWGSLNVDSDGSIRLWRLLDREGPGGPVGVAEVISVDRGRPPLSATATLTITVTDVNDCPPRLLPPTVVHVLESGPPSLLATLTATDPDVWALGHGPPFNFSLADTNPAFITDNINLFFNPHLDSGRGGAEVWTAGSLDREEHRQLEVQVRVADAGGIAATQVLTVIVDDINDNPMKPASKTVYLWKTQGGSSEAPLGRVYVDDPDDWDVEDKVFEWVGAPHPLFSLNRDTGTVFASSQVREGRYELRFSVSDTVRGQMGVSANVTVTVKQLPPLAITHATPLTLTPITPTALTKGWTTTDGGGVLGKLVRGVKGAFGKWAQSVEIVSVQGTEPSPPPILPFEAPSSSGGGDSSSLSSAPFAELSTSRVAAPSACVWMSVREPSGDFMDPVKLQGLLQLHSRELETAVNLTLRAGSYPGDRDSFRTQDFSAESLASTALPLQVVDSNTTALVTPRLAHSRGCQGRDPERCTPSTCLNGGRCVWSETGNRCVCPGWAQGSSCKVLARTFSGSGWAWVRPLVNCLPTTISFRVLTRRPHALLLYSGPLATLPRSADTPPSPLLAVQLWQGRPQLLLEDGGRPQKLEVNATVHDGRWHTVHIYLESHRVVMMVNLCGAGDEGEKDSHCVKRARVNDGHALLGSYPLQIGGLAHALPRPAAHGWREAPVARSLDGCISHLRLNGQLVDLGSPPYSHDSSSGCLPQEQACAKALGGCGLRGRCVGGLEEPGCECDPGWKGEQCATATAPATLGPSSYMKVALSLRPTPNLLAVQFRLRSRGARDGLLLQVSAHRQPDLSLYLRAGMACASLSEGGRVARAACVEGRPVGDGSWHTIKAERFGHNLVASVDDGDGWRRNESLVTLEEGAEGRGWEAPSPKPKKEQEDVVEEYVTVKLVTVQENLKDTCIDDVRVSGHHLPLPPAVNTTTWGEVTALHRIRAGCPANAPCVNTTCAAPLSCFSAWGQPTCSCGPGRQVVGAACKDVDECLWQPCLHGGACHNRRPGFLCECGPGHFGNYCQWARADSAAHSLLGPVAIVALILFLILVAVAGVILSLQIRRHLMRRSKRGRKGGADVVGGCEGGGEAAREKVRPEDREENEMTTLGLAEHEAQVECLSLTVQSEGRTKIFNKVEVLHACGVAVESFTARDDLRAYAYEGDGSSAGSLSSAFSGLRGEQVDEAATKQLVPYFLDVVDLIKNLPEATRSPSLQTRCRAKAQSAGENKEPQKQADEDPTRTQSMALQPQVPQTDATAAEGKNPAACISVSPGFSASAVASEGPPKPPETDPTAAATRKTTYIVNEDSNYRTQPGSKAKRGPRRDDGGCWPEATKVL